MNWLSSIFNNFGTAFRWYFVVMPWEQAIRVRLGNRVQKFGAGYHFKIPFVDQIYKQGVRARLIHIPALTLTPQASGGRAITCSGNFRFKVVDIEQLYNSVHMPDEVLQSYASGLLAEYITSRELEECSSPEAHEYVSKRLELSEYGLKADRFVLTDFVAVKTYRLIQDHMEKFNGFELDTNSPSNDTNYDRANGL